MCLIKLPTKPIFWLFHILKINRIMPFCNLFIDPRKYLVIADTTKHHNECRFRYYISINASSSRISGYRATLIYGECIDIDFSVRNRLLDHVLRPPSITDLWSSAVIPAGCRRFRFVSSLPSIDCKDSFPTWFIMRHSPTRSLTEYWWFVTDFAAKL